MKSGRAFGVMGAVVAIATAGMLAARHGTLRPEPLAFAAWAPPDTLLYVALPDHAAFARSVADAPSWKWLGLDPVLDRCRRAQPRLAEIAGPSAAFFLRHDGRWAAFLRLRGDSPQPSGEFEGLFWAAKGDVLALSDSADDARAAIEGPHEPLNLANDRTEVCGAARVPFAWLDLRRLPVPGPLADIGGLAFTATFGESIEVRALGNYYVRARERILAEYVHHPGVDLRPPPAAAGWIRGFASSSALWSSFLGSLNDEERSKVKREMDRLSVEFLKSGSIEGKLLAEIGPDWGLAVVDGPESDTFAFARTSVDPALFWRLLGGYVRFRQERGEPGFRIEDNRILIPSMKSPFERPVHRFDPGGLRIASSPALLEDGACGGFAEPPDGRWHVGAGFQGVGLRNYLEGVERRTGPTPALAALRGWLDRVPWLHAAELRGRYTDRGLRIEATLR